MLSEFLQSTFGRIRAGHQEASSHRDGTAATEGVDFTQAVDRVVDQSYARLRMIPDYNRRLRGPVKEAFRHIDDLVESVPPAILCCRSTYASDPKVNAFFAGPHHMQEVFSGSAEVRELFDSNPDSRECWALLCMRKEERRQLGMELVGDDVRREVLQTGVSFTDHQVISPGADEVDSNQALKCCIFNSLLDYIRRRASTAKEVSMESRNWRKVLQLRLARSSDESEAAELRAQIEQLEQKLAQESLHLVTLEDHLEFVAQVVGNPAQFISRGSFSMRLSRLGVKLDGESEENGYEVPLSEIRVASHEPRIAVLVRFPRSELLPSQDYLRRADLFLAG